MKTDLKNKTREELLKLVSEKREALKNFRFGIAGSRVKNVKDARSLRKDLARMLTYLRQR